MKFQLLMIVLLAGLFLFGCLGENKAAPPAAPNYTAPTTNASPAAENKTPVTPANVTNTTIAPPKSNLSAVIRPSQLAYQAQLNWGSAADYRIIGLGESVDLGEIQFTLTDVVLTPAKKASFKLFDSKYLEMGEFSMGPGEYVQIELDKQYDQIEHKLNNGSKFTVWVQSIGRERGSGYAEIRSYKLPR